MTKYIIGAILGIVLLLVLTYFAGVWSEKEASKIKGEDIATKDIRQDDTKVAKRNIKEPEPEPEPEPKPSGPPPIPEYPFAVEDENKSLIRGMLENKVTLDLDSANVQEALFELGKKLGIDINDDMLDKIIALTPFRYNAKNLNARQILWDICLFGNLKYEINADGISIGTRDSEVSLANPGSPEALDYAKEQFYREQSQLHNWLKEEFTFRGTAIELLQILMQKYGIVPTNSAYSAAEKREEELDIRVFSSADLADILNRELNLDMPKGRAEHPMKVIVTSDEVDDWNRMLEDRYFAKDNLNNQVIDGEMSEIQLYKAAKLIEEKTSKPVVPDENAWNYTEFLSLPGNSRTVGDMLNAIKNAGFVSILIEDKSSRREILYIFAVN